MKRIELLFCLLLFNQCKQETFESELIQSDTYSREVITYHYDSEGRLSQENIKTDYKSAQDSLSIMSKTLYIYDENGRKIRVNEFDTSDSISSTTFFTYDHNDSLLSKYLIIDKGDTISLEENTYTKDGKLELVKRRHLISNTSAENFFKSKTGYDTFFTTTENFYRDDLLFKSKDRDKGHTLTTEREYEYVEGKLSKLNVYSFLSQNKQLELTIHYPLKVDTVIYEKVTVNLLGDTIGLRQVKRNHKGKVTKVIDLDTEIGLITISHYNNLGQLVNELEIYQQLGNKIVRSYTYDSFGKIVRKESDNVPLTENEKNVL
jgi:hypothetical protein